jgi:hypothetical protein
MIIKIYWEKCREFVVEEEDAFFIEASPDEALGKLFPMLSPQEKLKFEQLKDVYAVKDANGQALAGRYYFLVSRGAKVIKFESAALLTSDLAARGGKAMALPDILISSLDELDAFDPSKY